MAEPMFCERFFANVKTMKPATEKDDQALMPICAGMRDEVSKPTGQGSAKLVTLPTMATAVGASAFMRLRDSAR